MVMGTAKHATACLITHHILQRKFLVNRDISEKTARSGADPKVTQSINITGNLERKKNIVLL